MESPVYNRRISKIHTLLSLWPYTLVVIAVIINIGFYSFGFRTQINELMTERGISGFLVYLLIKSWLFTSPIWLICCIYMLTQKECNFQETFVLSLIGLTGHLLNFILVF